MPAENARKAYVLDASYVLAFLLPDERHPQISDFFKGIVGGDFELFSTSLLPYEVLNALRVCVVRKRLRTRQAIRIFKNFEALNIKLVDLKGSEVLKTSIKRHLTSYDASYLLLATYLGLPLLTLDHDLIYN